MVGLACFDDPCSYAVEPLMPDSSKVRFQAGHGDLSRAETVGVHFRDASAHQTCLCKGTSNGLTPEEDSLKKAKLESANGKGQLSARAAGTKLPWTWHQGQLKEWTGFLVGRSLTLSSAHV